MLFIIEFVLILIIIVLALVDTKKIPTAYVVKQNPEANNNNFKILTRAVCEEKSKNIYCRDMLVARCNEKEFIVDNENLENFTGCNNLKINLSDIIVKGNGTFRKE